MNSQPVFVQPLEHERIELRSNRWLERRLGAIWLLLFFNCLPWIGVATVVPIPPRLAQLLTTGALGLALLLALGLNRRMVVRPNLVLGLLTLLVAVAAISGVRGTAGLGGMLRPVRLAAFLAVLWLITPWMGRRDLLLARCHFRALLAVCAMVLAGVLVAPSIALNGPDGRLAGVLWPIWPTAVAHFAAVAAGMAVVLWLSGSMGGIRTAAVLGIGVVMLLLSHTRVALIALIAGLGCASLTLFLVRRRVRRMMTLALFVVPIAAALLAPALLDWFARGQSAEQITALSGRRHVWDMLLDAPRPEFNHWFGYGLSDKGFAGLAIDNSWLALYQDEGLVGVTIVACVIVFLVVAAGFHPPGTARALAVFLAVYVSIHSYTEVGLGDASPYLLDLFVAASLLVPAARGPDHDREAQASP